MILQPFQLIDKVKNPGLLSDQHDKKFNLKGKGGNFSLFW